MISPSTQSPTKMVNQQKIYNSMPSNLSNFLLQPISQSQKNNLNLISKCEYNFLENEQTASARKRIHDQVVKVSCNNGDTGAQGSSDDNKKAKYDNTHSAYPESTGLAAEALPVCSPDNQEQSKTSAIVLENVTISPKDVQTIIEFNKNGVPSDIITKFLGYSEEIVDQIISEHEKTADIRKRQHDRTVNTNCNNRDTGAQCSSDDNKKARYDNTHSAYPESTGLAAEALPVCSPDNQEQSETSAIVLGKVTISPKEVQTIIEFNKNGFPADIIATSVGYSAKIVDQIIREQANSEVQEPINENNNVQLQEPSEKTVKFIEEHIKEKVLQQKKTTTQKTKNESAIKVGDIEISQEKVEAIIADENKIPQEVIASKYGYSKSTIKEVLIKANVSSQEIAIKTGIYYIDLKNVKDIIDQIDRGVPPSKIAEETGYSVRTINRIKKAKMLHV